MSELQSDTNVIKDDKTIQVVTFLTLNENVRLKVVTLKVDGLWITEVKAWRLVSTYGGNVFETHCGNTDFKKKLDVHSEIIRATEAVIKAAHAAVLAGVDNVYEEAFAFYN